LQVCAIVHRILSQIFKHQRILKSHNNRNSSFFPKSRVRREKAAVKRWWGKIAKVHHETFFLGVTASLCNRGAEKQISGKSTSSRAPWNSYAGDATRLTRSLCDVTLWERGLSSHFSKEKICRECPVVPAMPRAFPAQALRTLNLNLFLFKMEKFLGDGDGALENT